MIEDDQELPEAVEVSEDGPSADANAQSRNRKRIVGGVLVCAVVAGAGVVAWQMYGSPSQPKDDAMAAEKILTTARVASGRNSSRGEAAAEELNTRVIQLDSQLAELNQNQAALSTENAQLKAQLEAERADALRTIAVLERNGGGVGTQPAQAAPQPIGQQQPAPVMVAGDGVAPSGPDPFAPVGGGNRGTMVAGEEARPRRSFSTVRMTGQSQPIGNAARGATGASGQGSGGQAATGSSQFMSPSGQSYDSRNFVPPNAYVNARVLVGVDAQVGVTANSDPKPVLFRLTGPATHVGANGAYQTTDLTGCLVNGAAYGELSSEKIYIRLQRITCPAGNDRFSVATVEGYATHGGKAGVRGTVITREGGLTGRALIAGTLQGLGNSLSQYTNQVNRSIGVTQGGTLTTPELNSGDLATGSIGSGVSGAAGQLADYYIKRAEQYQPVIEMPTGINVELVFLSGFQIDRQAPAARRR